MPSFFDALDEALSAVVLDAFGETEAAVLRPRMTSQYTERADDPNREPVDLSGVLSVGPAVEDMRGTARHDRHTATRLATAAGEFWVPACVLADIPYAIAVGDLILFPARADAAYAVVSVQRTDLGDANLILAIEDQPEV
jgi:hypothetical protein